jgi:hypothetical protein
MHSTHFLHPSCRSDPKARTERFLLTQDALPAMPACPLVVKTAHQATSVLPHGKHIGT